MSADVHMTGAQGDLKMTDPIVEVDPRYNRQYSVAQAALAQQIHSAIMIAEREWFVNATEGVPWLRLTTQKSWNLDAVVEEIRRVVSEIPQVKEVKTVSATRSGRSISISLEVRLQTRSLISQIIIDPTAREQSILGDNGIYSVIFPVTGVEPI